MKSKIEEAIKTAREANEKMFAAFEELNERLLITEIIDISNHSQKGYISYGPPMGPKFKTGEWVRAKDGRGNRCKYFI